MPSELNPYAAPLAANEAQVNHRLDALEKSEHRIFAIGEVVIAWEKLRLWYNIVLALVTVAGVVIVSVNPPRRMASADIILAQISVTAVAANLCFCLGPLVEGYATWMFGAVRWLRSVVYVVGLGLSILLTIIVSTLISVGAF